MFGEETFMVESANFTFFRAHITLVLGFLATVIFFTIFVTSALAEETLLSENMLAVKAKKGLLFQNESESLNVRGGPGLISPEAIPSLGKNMKPQIILHFFGPLVASQIGNKDAFSANEGVSGHTLTDQEISEDGSFNCDIYVPQMLGLPAGAYLVQVELIVGGEQIATGQQWLGIVEPQASLDVAYIWPLTLGIHRDAEGVFFDSVLEEALTSQDGTPGRIQGIAAVAKMFPNWRFTLAVESVGLTQLSEMSKGYTRSIEPNGREEISPDQILPQEAAAALTSLKEWAALRKEGHEVVVAPYASPSMELIADLDWSDGLEQIQLGKQVAQQLLGVSDIIIGAYSPGLDVTASSLASYGKAFIDHLLVSSSVTVDLSEQIDDTVAVRVRDDNNHRVTLVFANEVMQNLIKPPWDIGLFYAGLAAELTSSPKKAIVIVPQPGIEMAPYVYMEAVGAALQRFDWIHTLTLNELVSTYLLSSRPLFLNRTAAGASSYIATEIQEAIRTARAAVEDVALSMGSEKSSTLSKAKVFLYMAESRWWYTPGATLQMANMGLHYAQLAQSTAITELEKLITIKGSSSVTFSGHDGTIKLSLENTADYPLKVNLDLTLEGLTLADKENSREFELKPGITEIPIGIIKGKGKPHLHAAIAAGSFEVASLDITVLFLTTWLILLWSLVAVSALAVLIFGGMLWKQKKNLKNFDLARHN